MLLRRKLALMICPDLAHLPYSASSQATPKLRSNLRSQRNGQNLRELDQLYAAHTGVKLVEGNAPAYVGPMYLWPSSHEQVRRRAVSALVRLRANQQVGAHPSTHFGALNYFASIWPAHAPWPDHIKRPFTPKTPKEEAA